MTKLSPLQLVIITVCIFLGIVGLLVFAFLGPKPQKSLFIGPVVSVWGAVPNLPMEESIQIIMNDNSRKSALSQLPLNIIYKYKDPATFKEDLLEAIARGQGPDVVILPLKMIAEEKSILFTIPFTSYPERTFKDTFIEEGDLFHESDGYFAIPFSIDPLVMYFNKTILTQADIVQPPQYWDQVEALVPSLTVLDANSKITKSAIALGEFRNLTNAKDVLSALFLQRGTTITSYSFNTATNADQLLTTLYASNASRGSLPPSISTLGFFTEFADPTKPTTYTWNRALPTSQDFFTAGNLAFYLGYGSEVSFLEKKNPNLNFDMSFIPQDRSTSQKYTYGNLYGISILKSSKNQAGSFVAVTSLSSNTFLKIYNQRSGLPPVRRDLLAEIPTGPYSPVLYESALKSKGWLDPDNSATDGIFMNMVESVLTGKAIPSEAVERAQLELQVLTEKIK